MTTRRKRTHGGKRDGAGRSTYFGGKKGQPQFSVLFTPAGFALLEKQRKVVNASRSDFLAALVKIYGETFGRVTEWKGKAPRPIALLFPLDAKDSLDIITHNCDSSKLSRSDVLESLLHAHAKAITADAIAKVAG